MLHLRNLLQVAGNGRDERHAGGPSGWTTEVETYGSNGGRSVSTAARRKLLESDGATWRAKNRAAQGRLVPEAGGRPEDRCPAYRLVMDDGVRTASTRDCGEERIELHARDPPATRRRVDEHAVVAAAEVDEPDVRFERQQVEDRVDRSRVKGAEWRQDLQLSSPGG